MKKFISGFLVGAIIFSLLGVAAATYIANPVSYKILVNGEEFVSDPPALEVEGRTYLPLRAMGQALGVPVNWNDELGQAEVGNSAPAAGAGEYSRQNPAPINTVQQLHKKNYVDDYTVAVRVVQTVRGQQAAAMIKQANMYNSPPDAGYEYIVAKIAFSVLSVADDKAVSISGWNFDAFSGNNEEYQRKYIVTPSPELTGQIYEGGNTEGYVVFHVKIDDPNPKIVYGQNYDGSGGIWFSLK